MSDQTPLFPASVGSAEGAAERAALLALLDDHTAALDEVDAALQRIDAGAYGRCIRCGQLIDPEVLAESPFVQLCDLPGGVSCSPAGPLPTAPDRTT